MAENIKKIAIFVEGQGELIFFRRIIFFLLNDKPFSFDSLELCSGQMRKVRYDYPNPNAKVHFMIVNVGNDAKVITAIKEREQSLIKKGYSKIIGLRDMYSEAYKKRTEKISGTVNNLFREKAESIIKAMSNPEKVSFHFSIMEIEAWWLSMYSIFERKNSRLTVDYINENLGFKLDEIDPETEFFHPAITLENILDLINEPYKKKYNDVESIMSNIEAEDIELITSSNRRYKSFRSFIAEIKSL